MRNRHHNLVERHDDTVNPPAAVLRRVYADWQRDHHHDHKRNDCHHHGNRQLGHNHVRNGQMVLVRSAKITAHKMNKPLQIPFQKRSV